MIVQKIYDVAVEPAVRELELFYAGEVLYEYRVVANVLGIYGQYYVMGDLYTRWKWYVYENIENLYRLYNAYKIEYNPLENYNSTESLLDITQDGNTIVTHEPLRLGDGSVASTVETTSTVTGEMSNKNFVTTYDSDEPHLQTETKSIPKDYKTISHTIDATSYTDVTSHERTEVEFEGDIYHGDKIFQHTLKKSGNIGVTTSQQMLESEIPLRLHRILLDFVENFVRTYCFYVGSSVEMEGFNES